MVKYISGLFQAPSPSNGKGRGDWPLHDRPGFLIRRLHQIHVNIFNSKCEEFRITPLQYTVLTALQKYGSADQTTISGRVLLDRITTTDVIKRLSAKHLIRRTKSDHDRRSQLCSITHKGSAVVQAIEASAKKAHRETLSPLSAEERTMFVKLMKKIVLQREHGKELEKLKSSPRVKRLAKL